MPTYFGTIPYVTSSPQSNLPVAVNPAFTPDVVAALSDAGTTVFRASGGAFDPPGSIQVWGWFDTPTDLPPPDPDADPGDPPPPVTVFDAHLVVDYLTTDRYGRPTTAAQVFRFTGATATADYAGGPFRDLNLSVYVEPIDTHITLGPGGAVIGYDLTDPSAGAVTTQLGTAAPLADPSTFLAPGGTTAAADPNGAGTTVWFAAQGAGVGSRSTAVGYLTVAPGTTLDPTSTDWQPVPLADIAVVLQYTTPGQPVTFRLPDYLFNGNETGALAYFQFDGSGNLVAIQVPDSATAPGCTFSGDAGGYGYWDENQYQAASDPWYETQFFAGPLPQLFGGPAAPGNPQNTAYTPADIVTTPSWAVADRELYSGGGTLTLNPLANDGQPYGSPPSLVSVTQPAHGTVAVNPDGTLAYTGDVADWDEDADPDRVDTFTYTAEDIYGNQETATVTVVWDPPLDYIPPGDDASSNNIAADPPPPAAPVNLADVKAYLSKSPDGKALLDAATAAGVQIVLKQTDKALGYFVPQSDKIVLRAQMTDVEQSARVLAFELLRWQNKATQVGYDQGAENRTLTAGQYAILCETLTYKIINDYTAMAQKAVAATQWDPGMDNFGSELKSGGAIENLNKFLDNSKNVTGHYQWCIDRYNEYSKKK